MEALFPFLAGGYLTAGVVFPEGYLITAGKDGIYCNGY